MRFVAGTVLAVLLSACAPAASPTPTSIPRVVTTPAPRLTPTPTAAIVELLPTPVPTRAAIQINSGDGRCSDFYPLDRQVDAMIKFNVVITSTANDTNSVSTLEVQQYITYVKEANVYLVGFIRSDTQTALGITAYTCDNGDVYQISSDLKSKSLYLSGDGDRSEVCSPSRVSDEVVVLNCGKEGDYFLGLNQGLIRWEGRGQNRALLRKP